MRLIGHPLGVQQLAVTAGVLLLLSTSIAVSGLLWSSALLQETSVTLVRAANDLRLANDLEQALFTHQRLAILADPATGETEQDAQAIVQSIEAARSQARDRVQAQLLDTMASQASAYFDRYASAILRARTPVEASSDARPAFDSAIDIVRAFGADSEAELARGNLRAQRLASLFKLTAVAAALLALTLVLLLGVAVRKVILRPISGIRETLLRFRRGEHDVQADENIAPELAEIAGAFNDMKTELARQREQRLAFLGGVAHDLRNPLAALKTAATALEMGPSDPALTRQTIGVLQRQLDNMEQMCRDLLEASRAEAGMLSLNAQPFDVGEAARAVTDLYRPVAESRQLVLELEPEAVVVTADRLRIEQVIGNLVKNALKHTPADGAVTVRVSRWAGGAEISVSDNGVGIREDELQSIFLAFTHGSVMPSTGAGLGLFVVHRIVASHGGSIGVESRLGAGSQFTVRLPAEPKSAENQLPTPPAPPPGPPPTAPSVTPDVVG